MRRTTLFYPWAERMDEQNELRSDAPRALSEAEAKRLCEELELLVPANARSQPEHDPFANCTTCNQPFDAPPLTPGQSARVVGCPHCDAIRFTNATWRGPAREFDDAEHDGPQPTAGRLSGCGLSLPAEVASRLDAPTPDDARTDVDQPDQDRPDQDQPSEDQPTAGPGLAMPVVVVALSDDLQPIGQAVRATLDAVATTSLTLLAARPAAPTLLVDLSDALALPTQLLTRVAATQERGAAEWRVVADYVSA